MTTMGTLGMIGGKELLLILAILILLFGASRIPSLARALGKSVKEFKKGQQEGDKDGASEAEEEKKDEPASGQGKP